MYPLPAVVFSWVLAAVAAGCVGWLAISIRRFTRSLRTISVPLLVIQVVLLSLLWAISGVIFSGDIAAVLGWSNPIEGVSGIVIGATCASALFITANTTVGEAASMATGRFRRASQWLVLGGLVAISAGFGLTMLLKFLDPGAAAS